MKLASRLMIPSLLALAPLPGAYALECPSALERSLTLRNPVPGQVEAAHGRAAAGVDSLSFHFPRYGSSGCEEGPAPRLSWGDSIEGIGLLLLAGEEFRFQNEGLAATELGGIARGRRGPVSFHVDARTYTDVGGEPDRPSFDRESIDEQTAEVSGAFDYRSYSRFRGDLTLDLPFGTLTAAREAAHWGPALFGNLMFNQEAVPFFQYVFTTRLGPLRVASLYGDLSVARTQASSTENLVPRSLYAHRYELSVGRNVLVGATEQIILYDMTKAFLFAPVFPLFIAKGFLVEDNTNGNLGADVAWRTPWSTVAYAEFLLDDLESPGSLFTKDYAQNKWGAVAGLHWTHGPAERRLGAILEYSHVEPWVYAHFVPRTAQAANVGYPLGNPFGADSRNLVAKSYFRNGGVYLAAKGTLSWKGQGPGADLESPIPTDPFSPKNAQQGVNSPEGAVDLEAAYLWRWLGVYGAGRAGDDIEGRLGVRAYY